jgi:diguanylate cyclase (GGDEF)-like protein
MRPDWSRLQARAARLMRPIRFEDPELERQFLEHDCSATIPLARFCYASAVFIWAGFGLLDAAVGGETTSSLWTIRFAVGEPTILAALAITFVEPLWPRLKEVGLAVTLVLGSCVIWMVLVLEPPVSEAYYVGVILVLFPAYVFAQVRLVHAVAASAVLVAAYHGLALTRPSVTAATAATNLTFMVTTAYIGLVACFLLERARRRDFVQSLEIARSHDELRRLSSHDELTGLLNRRRLEPELAAAIAEFRSRGRTAAVMMIDLDHFKLVNDRHGHAVGDRILVEAAASITERLKRTDSAFRVGGDEFVVLLPGVTRPAAAEIASRIQSSFAARAESVVLGGGPPVAMSVGITEIRSGADTPSGLLGLADEALYAAKPGRAAGRERLAVGRWP